MMHRLTYRKRHSYASNSNQTRVVKTPGGSRCTSAPRRGRVGRNAPSPARRSRGYLTYLRPAEYKRSRLPRNRTVNRLYGRVLSGPAVRERIIRAFSVEEQKIVKKVLKIQKVKDKQSTK